MTLPSPDLQPEYAALADAYLTLRAKLQSLIVSVQAHQNGTGLSLPALVSQAEALIPLLDEPSGKNWTDEYWRQKTALIKARHHLKAFLLDLDQDYRSDWLARDALTVLEGECPP